VIERTPDEMRRRFAALLSEGRLEKIGIVRFSTAGGSEL